MANKTLWDIVSENVTGESDFSLAHKRLNTPRLELLPPEVLPSRRQPAEVVAAPQPTAPVNPMLTGALPTRTWGEAIVDPFASLGKGTLQFGKGLVDAVAPGSALSSGMNESIDSLNMLQSQRWQAQNARDAAAIQAEDSQLGKFALGAKQAISNPDKLIGLLGQIAPTVATGVLGLGAKGMLGLQGLIGAAQGAGAVRGGIHENVMTAPVADLKKSSEFNTLLESYDEPTARKMLADKASSLQESGDLVALATLVGGASGVIGLGSSLAKVAGNAATKQTAKTAAKTIAKEVATEVPEEGGQQYGSNLGASRTGMKIDLSKGVAESMGAATVMGAVGGGIGARIEHTAASNQPSPLPGQAPKSQQQTDQSLKSRQQAAQNYRNAVDNPVLNEQGDVDQTIVAQAREQFVNTFDDPATAQTELAKIDGELNGTGTTTETVGGGVPANDTGTANGSTQGNQGADASTRSAQSIVEAVRGSTGEPSSIGGSTGQTRASEGSRDGTQAGTVTPGVEGLPNQQELGGVGTTDSTVTSEANAGAASSKVAQLTPSEKIEYVRKLNQSKGIVTENPLDIVKRAVAYQGTQADVNAAGDAVVVNFLAALESKEAAIKAEQAAKAEADALMQAIVKDKQDYATIRAATAELDNHIARITRSRRLDTAIQDSIDSGFSYPDTVIGKVNQSFSKVGESVLTAQERDRIKTIINSARVISEELEAYQNELLVDKNTDGGEIENALSKRERNAKQSRTEVTENPLHVARRAVAYRGTWADVKAAGDKVVTEFLAALESKEAAIKAEQAAKAEADALMQAVMKDKQDYATTRAAIVELDNHIARITRSRRLDTAVQESIDSGFSYPDTVIDKVNQSFSKIGESVLTAQERDHIKTIINSARVISEELEAYQNELLVDKNTDGGEIENALSKGKKNAKQSRTETRKSLPGAKKNADSAGNVSSEERPVTPGDTGQEAGVHAGTTAQTRVETPAQQNATRRLNKADDAGHLDVTEYSEVESLITKGDLLGAMTKLNKYARQNGGDVKYSTGGVRQTETSAFKKWFGDSKVVDADGKPLVVYRGEGSGEDRNIYDTTTTRESGVFTTPDKEIARIYERGGEPRAFYVKADKVLDLTQDTEETRKFISEWASNYDEWVDRVTGEEVDPVSVVLGGTLFDYEGDWSSERWRSLQSEALYGNDAVYLNDFDNGSGVFRALVVGDTAQMKSATSNNGNFDGTNPDIRHSTGEVHSTQQMTESDFDNDVPSILLSIANNKDNVVIHRALARVLSPLLKNTSIELVPQLVTEDGRVAYGLCSIDGSQIKISVDGGMTPTVMLHEAVHAATERIIQMDKSERTPAQHAGVVELSRIRAAAKKRGLNLSDTAKGSLSEFVAEALTDTTTIGVLSREPWKLGTMWDNFKSTILSMLGMSQPKTMAEGVAVALEAIFSPVPSNLTGNSSAVNYSLAAQQMPNAGLPTTARAYEANRLGNLARQFVDTANYLMLSLDKWAFKQDGNQDGNMVNLKLDFESAFYRSRNQKAVFTEGFKRTMFDPLVEQVRGVAKASNDTVESIMEHVNNVAIARRVLEDSSSISRDQSALAGALIEQSKMVRLLPEVERLSVGTGLTDAAKAVARLMRSPDSVTIDDFNAVQKLLATEAASAASLIATSPSMVGVDTNVAFELATINNLKIQQGDSVTNSIGDLSQVANRLADLFGKTGDKTLKARVGRRELAQLKQVSNWDKAQNRPTPDTDTDVRLPAGMTIKEAFLLIQAAGQHVATNQINQLADTVRDNFKTLSDFAVQHGVTDAASVTQSRLKRPNYVSFSANPDMEAGDYVTHNNRAFLDHAEGSTSYMHGGNLNVFHTLVAKTEQSAHMASVQERNTLAYTLATKNAPGFELGSPQSARNNRIQANVNGVKKFVVLNKKDWSSQAFLNAASEPTPAAEAARTATRFFGSLVVHGVLLAAPVLGFKDMSTRMFNSLGADFERTTGKKLDTIRLNRKFATAMASPSVWQAAWAEATGKELPGIHKAFKDAGGLLTFMGDHPVTNTAIDKMFAEPGMVKSGWIALKGALHTWNQLFQSVPPIALYSALLGEGVAPTKASAAVLSQMNLRKMGEMTRSLQTAYAFLNPSAQDAMTTKRTFVDSRGNWNKKAVVAATSITMFSYIAYTMLRESDKDDPYMKGRKRMDSLQNSVVTNGFKVPVSDGYFTVPVGFGWPQTFMGLGVMAARAADGVVSTKDAVLDVLKLAVKPGMLTGESSADLSKDPMLALTQILLPDLVVGVVGVAQNKTPFGTPIETASSLPNAPYLHKQGRPKTAEVWKDGAQLVHQTLGIDVAPERLRAYIEALTPGVLSGGVAAIEANDRESKGLKEKDGYGWLGKTIGASRVYTPLSDDQVLNRDFYTLKDIADELGRKVKEEKTPLKWSSMSAPARGVWLQNHGWEKKDADLLVAKMRFDSENAQLSNDYKSDRNVSKVSGTYTYLDAQDDQRRGLQVEFLKSVMGYTH